MKRIKLALTCITLAIATTGVVIANGNENKRTTHIGGYFRECTDPTKWCSVSLSGSYFDDSNISLQAALRDDNNVWHNIYLNQCTCTPLKFICP